jgi:hypothetical protein
VFDTADTLVGFVLSTSLMGTGSSWLACAVGNTRISLGKQMGWIPANSATCPRSPAEGLSYFMSSDQVPHDFWSGNLRYYPEWWHLTFARYYV